MNALSPQTADALAATTILSGAGPDAELIALCSQFDVLERRRTLALNTAHTPEEDDAASLVSEEVHQQQAPLVDRILELPCSTLAGFRAIAGSLAAWDAELLKGGSGSIGECLTTKLVEALLEIKPAPNPDAELIALCTEYRASDAAYCDIHENGGDDDDARAVLAQPLVDSWEGMLDRMAELRATSSDGLAARAFALAQHSGIKPGTSAYPIAFNPDDGTITGRLLHYLLRDAVAMQAPLPPNPDADLLALRPEFERQRADYETVDGENEESLSEVCQRFDHLCIQIVHMPLAVTRAGRAFQAIALMHQLTYICADQDGYGSAPHAAWHLLRRQVGDEFPLPRVADPVPLEASSFNPPDPWYGPDAELLALRPEYLRLRALCDVENAADRDWTDEAYAEFGQPFEDLIADINARPPAETASGRALKAVAVMEELYLEGLNTSVWGRSCWELLAREVGDAYRLPGERS